MKATIRSPVRNMPPVTKVKAILEIDHGRGVVYVHLSERGDIRKYQLQTAVRIGGLGSIPPLSRHGMIDIVAAVKDAHR